MFTTPFKVATVVVCTPFSYYIVLSSPTVRLSNNFQNYLSLHCFLQLFPFPHLQVPRFRIVRSNDGEVHAEFLVVVSIGSHSTVTFGLWRRHSDFHKLSVKVNN